MAIINIGRQTDLPLLQLNQHLRLTSWLQPVIQKEGTQDQKAFRNPLLLTTNWRCLFLPLVTKARSQVPLDQRLKVLALKENRGGIRRWGGCWWKLKPIRALKISSPHWNRSQPNLLLDNIITHDRLLPRILNDNQHELQRELMTEAFIHPTADMSNQNVHDC